MTRLALATLAALIGVVIASHACATPCAHAVDTWGHRLTTASPVNAPLTRPLAIAACRAVAAEAEAVGLNPDVAVAVAVGESHWRLWAFRSTGERGVMQAKPYHCETYLDRECRDVDDHVRAGVRYLAAMVERADGNEYLGLAAYRCGWAGSRNTNNWPQCRGYSSRVMVRVRQLEGRG